MQGRECTTFRKDTQTNSVFSRGFSNKRVKKTFMCVLLKPFEFDIIARGYMYKLPFHLELKNVKCLFSC